MYKSQALRLWGPDDEVRPPQEQVDERFEEARGIVAAVRSRWQDLLDRIDETFPALQSHASVVSWKAELRSPLGYVICLAVMAISAIGMLIWFKRRGWLGRRET